MSRLFPDFLKAFEAYADDAFVPKQFSTWTGLSIIAGALERKVWLPWSHTYAFYPNIYVLLVSGPGVGKSTAMQKGTSLLEDMNRKAGTLMMLSNQITEAKLVDEMRKGKSFLYRWTEEKSLADGTKQLIPRELTVFQNAGYYYASEASDSLRNIFGDFIACLTAFYDCPATWKRATKKDGVLELKNVCLNILAGSTFDYLGKLISDENIQGGFASRMIYVVHKEKLVREQAFQSGLDGTKRKLRDEYRTALVEDLIQINKLTGPMHADPEFSAAWEAWFPRFEEQRQSYASEKLQSLAARTNTNVLKVSMLLSAAESDDCVLKLRHWEHALKLVTTATEQIPDIFQEAKAKQGPKGASGGSTAAYIMVAVKRGNATRESVINGAVAYGYPKRMIEETVDAMIKSSVLRIGAVVAGQGAHLILGPDADTYL